MRATFDELVNVRTLNGTYYISDVLRTMNCRVVPQTKIVSSMPLPGASSKWITYEGVALQDYNYYPPWNLNPLAADIIERPSTGELLLAVQTFRISAVRTADYWRSMLTPVPIALQPVSQYAGSLPQSAGFLDIFTTFEDVYDPEVPYTKNLVSYIFPPYTWRITMTALTASTANCGVYSGPLWNLTHLGDLTTNTSVFIDHAPTMVEPLYINYGPSTAPAGFRFYVEAL